MRVARLPALPADDTLVDLIAPPERLAELKRTGASWPQWEVTGRQRCDLELLLCGAFSPLRGFLGRAAYESVCERMRLPDGTVWPIPITLDVTEAVARQGEAAGALWLRDRDGTLLAAIAVEEIWRPDRMAEAARVYGTTSPAHPGVVALRQDEGSWCVAGRLEGVALPSHAAFVDLRATPGQLRAMAGDRGGRPLVGFQTRNPMHRAHVELTLRAARQTGGSVLLHPVVGLTRPGDIDAATRVRCYRAALAEYPPGLARLAVLPLAMRMAGPREAVWHAIIRRNYGCSHFIVGRDHAGPGSDERGVPFYEPYAAQRLCASLAQDLGISILPFREMVYLGDERRFVPEDEVPSAARVATLSGTELRQRLASGAPVPAWFTFPRVAAVLQDAYPPRHRQGLTVFFTGLSGSGKSTVADALAARLAEIGPRRITVLDGDLVRKMLSSELGFSREHRDLNIRRIGWVASEIVRHGGLAICAPIAPYDSVRKDVRRTVEAHGGFLLVHLSTPLPVCEARDRKGLYAKARAGLVQHFTGISDPYEVPDDADLTVDTSTVTTAAVVDRIVDLLGRKGYLATERDELLREANEVA